MLLSFTLTAAFTLLGIVATHLNQIFGDVETIPAEFVLWALVLMTACVVEYFSLEYATHFQCTRGLVAAAANLRIVSDCPRVTYEFGEYFTMFHNMHAPLAHLCTCLQHHVTVHHTLQQR